MKESYEIFARRLLGVRRERMIRGTLLGVLLFFSLRTAGIRLSVAPQIKCLMVLAVTGGTMWKAILAKDMEKDLRHLFLLPTEERELVSAYVLVLGIYVFFLRTGPLLAVLSAVCSWKIKEVFLCLSGMCLGILVPVGIRFFARRDQGIYAFCPEASRTKKQPAPDWKIKGRPSIPLYFFRYLMAHKNYLVNTVALLGVALVLPLFLEMLEVKIALPMGFALLSLNTPFQILLSCDPSLERMVRFLPGQKKTFFLPYGMLLFWNSLIINGVCLVSWTLQKGSLTRSAVLLALWYSLQSASGAVVLECFFPVRNWRVESDLWHHPRKYVLPGILLLEAMLFAL